MIRRVQSLLPLALIAAALAGCRPARQAVAETAVPPGEIQFAPDSPKLTSIDVDTVRLRSEKVVAVLPAQLALDEDHTVRVTSPVAGRIRALDAQPGDVVASGSSLAHIVSADVAQAQSDLQRAEAALSVASAGVTRTRDLFNHQVVAQRDLQQAVSDSTQARAERDRAAARVQQLGAGSAVGPDFVLRAPIGGEVVDRASNPGMEVRPDLPQPLFTISSLDTLWLTASVYERDLGAVRQGQRVSFTSDALPGQQVVSTVSYVGAVLDPVTRTAMLRALVVNRGRTLRPATFGEVRVIAPEHDGVLVVPTRALVTHGNDEVVFVQAGPGHFVMRPVRIGADDGETAVILGGLKAGDLVVTRGSLLLSGEAAPGR